MVTKQTRNVIEVKIALEKNESVRAYIAFISLPVIEQQRIFEEWEQYYRDVRQTTTHAMYRELREAYAKGDTVRFKQLHADMKDMKQKGLLPELDKPKSTEPLALYNDQLVINYRNVLQEIQRGGSSLEF